MTTLAERISSFFSGNDSTTDEGLRDLFISELKTAYYLEKRAVHALAEQAQASTTSEVGNLFRQHQTESETQVERLEEIFKIIGIKTEEHTSDAIDGLINDARHVISITPKGSLTRDAGLIIAAQKVEHLEIATYGSLVTLARVLDFTQSTELLEKTLQEEKEADKKLTMIAESFINDRSKAEEDQHAGSHHASRHESHTPDVTSGGPLGV
ncbi:hypothetical protein GCM10027592_59170 [Spirosoma flavus]